MKPWLGRDTSIKHIFGVVKSSSACQLMFGLYQLMLIFRNILEKSKMKTAWKPEKLVKLYTKFLKPRPPRESPIRKEVLLVHKVSDRAATHSQ